MMKWCMLFVVLLCGPGFSIAGTPIKKVSNSKGLAKDFGHEAWTQGWKHSDFKLQKDYQSFVSARVGTTLDVIQDGKHLYIRVKAQEPKMGAIHVGPNPVDSYLSKFPVGDHIEILIGASNKMQFAFDVNGNKYSATHLRNHKICNFALATRKTDKGWEAIFTLPMSEIRFHTYKKTLDFGLQVVRHSQYGEDVERSYAKGKRSGESHSLTVER